jgi:hypothetical protein
MVSFFERTWFLWWMFALIMIARHGQMLSADFASSGLDSSGGAKINRMLIKLGIDQEHL